MGSRLLTEAGGPALHGTKSERARQLMTTRTMSTSDFPLLLANVQGKRLLEAYDEEGINFEVNQEEVRKITQEAIRQKRTKNCKEVLQDLVEEYLRRGHTVTIHFNDQANTAHINFNATPFMLSYLTEDLESYLIGVRNIFDSEVRKRAESATQVAASMNDVDAKVKSEVAREVARIMAEMATAGKY
jgi:hypothetical protein